MKIAQGRVVRGAITTPVLLLPLVALAGCALASTRQERKEAEVVGNHLVAAGFRPVPADTPEKKAHLETMPKLLFSSVVRNGKRHYLVADPYRCRCVYLGDEAAYQRYTEREIAEEEASSERAVARDERDAEAMDRERESHGPYDADVVWPSGTVP